MGKCRAVRFGILGIVAEIGRRTTSTGALPSRKGYSKQKAHAGSNPADTTICADKASWEDNWGTLV